MQKGLCKKRRHETHEKHETGRKPLPDHEIFAHYFLYYLRTEEFLKQMFMYRTGAAIPAVSDTDLANIEIYIPLNGEKEVISSQIKKAFELKQEFKKQLKILYLKLIDDMNNERD